MSERSLDSSPLSWAALLGRWVEFAQASVSFRDHDGPAWRASVAPLIQLQAVTFALGELDRLAEADRPFARDRASVLVRESATALDEAWRGESLPRAVLDVLEDARQALDRSAFAGATELVWPGPGPLEMPELDLDDVTPGSLAVMQPGTIVMPGEPVLWWIGPRPAAAASGALAGMTPERPAVPRQVYRMLDQDGRIIEDVVQPVTDDPVAGLPLLVPLRHGGETVGAFTVDPDSWRDAQSSALDGRDSIPVRHVH